MPSSANDEYQAYPNSDSKGRHIPYEIARPAGLYIYQLAQNEAQSLSIQPSDVGALAVWSDSDLLVVYADVEPVWDYNTLIEYACFCPALSTTMLEANKNTAIWLIPISSPITPGADFTVTVQRMQPWKALGQNPQLGISG